MLVEKYREQKQLDRAEQLLSELHQEFPDESNLAAALVQVVSLEAAEAAARNQTDRNRQLNGRAMSMIRDFRARYPNALSPSSRPSVTWRRARWRFPPGRSPSRTRLMSWTRARAWLHHACPRVTPHWTSRARWPRAYADALERERGPQQLEIRILLRAGRKLKNNQPEEAASPGQPGHLAAERNRLDAVLLQARAMAESGATPTAKSARQKQAIARLEQVIKANPVLQMRRTIPWPRSMLKHQEPRHPRRSPS